MPSPLGQAQVREKARSHAGKTPSHQLAITESAFPHGNLLPANWAQPCPSRRGRNGTFSYVCRFTGIADHHNDLFAHAAFFLAAWD